MRLSDLAAATGVPRATVKYYLREGLLPAGTATAPNQATYGEGHARRLRLIRALREVGGLPIEAVRDVVRALEDDATPLHEVLGVAQHALGPQPPPEREGDLEARAEVDALLEDLGWAVDARAPGRAVVASALGTLRRLGRDVDADALRPYARVALDLAAWELGQLPADGSDSRTVEGMVVGTVVYEAVLVALRRLAHEHLSSQAAGV